jgi:hypothetical protein
MKGIRIWNTGDRILPPQAQGVERVELVLCVRAKDEFFVSMYDMFRFVLV